MILEVHVTTKDYSIRLTDWMRTRDWIVQLIVSKTQLLHMLTGFARTAELFKTEKTLRAYADHWNWLGLGLWSSILNFDAPRAIVNLLLSV
jgi:hypothetical protein